MEYLGLHKVNIKMFEETYNGKKRHQKKGPFLVSKHDPPTELHEAMPCNAILEWAKILQKNPEDVSSMHPNGSWNWTCEFLGFSGSLFTRLSLILLQKTNKNRHVVVKWLATTFLCIPTWNIGFRRPPYPVQIPRSSSLRTWIGWIWLDHYPLVNSHNYGKPPFFMGQLAINMAIFKSKLLVYQRAISFSNRRQYQFPLGMHLHNGPSKRAPQKSPAAPARSARRAVWVPGSAWQFKPFLEKGADISVVCVRGGMYVHACKHFI